MEVDEKDENVASMRMIIEKWKAQETNEKVENKNGQKQGEKRKPEFLKEQERGPKSISQLSLRQIDSKLMSVKKT